MAHRHSKGHLAAALAILRAPVWTGCGCAPADVSGSHRPSVLKDHSQEAP
jgi:hypothetical protein